MYTAFIGGKKLRATMDGDSGARRTGFLGEREKSSGLNANSGSGGKANGFRSIPESFSRWPGMIFRS